MDIKANRQFYKLKAKAIEDGIEHMSGCEYYGRSIPINECRCNCYELYWFEAGLTAGRYGQE